MANRPRSSAPTAVSSMTAVILVLSGVTWHRYFQVSRVSSMIGSKRGSAKLSPSPASIMNNWSNWRRASRPSDPDCTGSRKKSALKNHPEGSTSFSLRTRPRPAAPPPGTSR